MAENSDSDEPQRKKLRKDDTTKQSNAEDECHRREVDFGITEYISKHQGFTAVIKQRYSDFLVNEVSEDGEIVHLTDVSLPTCDKEEEKPCTPDLLEFIPEDQVQELRGIEEKKTGEVWIEVGEDKDKRTKLHRVIRENFHNLESATTDKDGKKYIKVFSADVKHSFNKYQHERDKKRNRPIWPKGRGDYCQFVLYKENKDTPDAVNQIAKVLRMNAGQFHYAGTKDRRSKSSQLVTVYRVTATRLYHLNKRFNFLTLGNFKYCKSPLKLGMLKGNHFTIILRNVTGTDEQVNEGVSTIKNTGFINYFGMQRFGTSKVPTHHMGRAILQNKWLEAVDFILQPRNDAISEARKIWKETGDAKSALDSLGPHPCIERHLLMGLAKAAPNDIVGALSYIPRNSRHMYLHSYQSFVWNSIVSERIKLHGLKPVTGDLVLSEQEATSQEDVKDDKNKRPMPKVITEDNINEYSIYDVVLPLPGYDVILPENDTGKLYEELLEKDGLNMGSFKHKVKDYAMPGGYRHILVHPQNLSHEILSYEDYRIPLILSDNDIIQGKELPKSDTDEGNLKAVKLELTLPRSAYATMALREVLKCDTSASYQIALNTT